MEKSKTIRTGTRVSKLFSGISCSLSLGAGAAGYCTNNTGQTSSTAKARNLRRPRRQQMRLSMQPRSLTRQRWSRFSGRTATTSFTPANPRAIVKLQKSLPRRLE